MSHRFFRRAIIAGILGVVLYLAHPWLLQGMAGWLLANASAGSADAVAIVGGDQRFDWAAQRYQEDPSTPVLLFQGPPDRLATLKITQLPSERDRETLRDRGVPDENIQVLSYSRRDEWEWARRLDDWLEEHPDQTVAVCCEQFQSGYTRCLLDQSLRETRRNQVIIHPLADRRYDPSNWWKNRAGVKAFWYGGFNLLYAAWVGEDVPPEATWDPDTYAETLGS